MIEYLVYLSIMTGIYGILSLSLNLQYGFTGLANFGHVAFFCLGAYTSTLLVVLVKGPFLLGLLGGMVVAGCFGFLISIPTAKLKEDYWKTCTLCNSCANNSNEKIKVYPREDTYILSIESDGVLPFKTIMTKTFEIFNEKIEEFVTRLEELEIES